MKFQHLFFCFYFLALFSCSGTTDDVSEDNDGKDSTSVKVDTIVEEVLPAPIDNPEFSLFSRPMAHITAFEVEDSTHIWVGASKKGLFQIDTLESVNLNPRNSGINYLTREIHCDRDGNIWVSSSVPNQTVSMYDGSSWTTFGAEVFGEYWSPFDIAEDDRGVVHFGGQFGVMSCVNKEWEQVNLPMDSCQVSQIVFNDIGDMAVEAYKSGSYLFVRRGGDWTTYPEDSPELALGPINSLLMDKESNVFVGCSRGVAVLSDNHYEHYQGDDMEIENFVYGVQAMAEDNQGRIWMCSDNGLIRYENGKFITVPVLDDEGGAYRLTEIEIRNQTIWLVANNQLVLKSD